jgi:hypothetical protein
MNKHEQELILKGEIVEMLYRLDLERVKKVHRFMNEILIKYERSED